MTAFDHGQRAIGDTGVVQWNPGREHPVRDAGRPVRVVSVPTHRTDSVATPVGRLVDRLIIEQSD